MIGHTPLNREVRAGIDRGFLTLVQGQSGSGKTRLGNNILLQMMKEYGDKCQYAIIDPKLVGYIPFKKRAHVYTNETEWMPLLEALNNEMLRRYSFMAEQEISEFKVSDQHPYILLVIDEMAAVTNNQRLLKKERMQIETLLTSYTNQCRQAAMGLMILCQSCDSGTFPTVVRSNCSTRIAMKTSGSTQVSMISEGRAEECPCDLLTLPGEFFALTSETKGKWIRGRTFNMTTEEELSVIEQYASDKRTPYCLDWDNPEFLG